METPQESAHNTMRNTLARLEAKIDKIDRTIHPPFWIKLLRWIGRNFFTILVLIVIIVISIEAWSMYQDIITQLNEIKSMPTEALDTTKNTIQNVIDKVKFW